MLKTLFLSLVIASLSLFAIEDSNVTATHIEQDTNVTDKTKIIFLYIDNTNCEYCRELDKMLQRPKPAELLSKYFIIKRKILNEDLELPKGLPLPYGTPTVYFIDSENNAVIEPMRGEKTEEQLLDFLNEAISEKKRMHQEKKEKSENLWEQSLQN